VSLRGGGRGEVKTKTTTRRAAADSQSAIEFVVQGSCVAANQQMQNCKQVSFRWSACPAARPRLLRPPLQSRRLPSFPPVFRRFSSFLGRFALDPRRFPALCRLGRAKHARFRPNGLSDVYRNTNAVHLSRHSNVFKSLSDQIVRARGARALSP